MAKIFFPVIFAVMLASLPVVAEDWTTTDGKIYKGVTVVKIEADAVTILDDDGGALVPLCKLPPDLQIRFGYDPVKAKEAAEQRVASDKANANALQAEMSQANMQKQAQLKAEDAKPVQQVPEPPKVTPGIDPVTGAWRIKDGRVFENVLLVRVTKSVVVIRCTNLSGGDDIAIPSNLLTPDIAKWVNSHQRLNDALLGP